MNEKEFSELFSKLTTFKKNPYHPLVWINGNPKIGKNVSIGFFSEVNAKNAKMIIGDNCDIASFVSINCADSHKKCIGVVQKTERKNIIIENNVFVGSHSVIKGGAHISHHSVVAAGTIVEGIKIPPYSLVIGNPMKVKINYYHRVIKKIIQHNKPEKGYHNISRYNETKNPKK